MNTQNCSVLLKTINENYSEGCKKGKVYGQEKAFGIDTYVGDFRKGLPDAKGTYT